MASMNGYPVFPSLYILVGIEKERKKERKKRRKKRKEEKKGKGKKRKRNPKFKMFIIFKPMKLSTKRISFNLIKIWIGIR